MEVSVPPVQLVIECGQVGIDEGKYNWDRDRCGRRRVWSISEPNGNCPLVSLANRGEDVDSSSVGGSDSP